MRICTGQFSFAVGGVCFRDEISLEIILEETEERFMLVSSKVIRKTVSQGVDGKYGLALMTERYPLGIASTMPIKRKEY